MKLSVIIVNYNVKYFLEQCLYSVNKAAQSVNTEVIVVDNNSVDGSTAMIRKKFPEVKLIENKKNVGFSKANNQGIKIAEGEYILLLNPDTIVEESTFEQTVQFMDEHPDAGGLGVKMIDGKGEFLPESKRGLPTPAVAFYKIFGLSKFFPKSQKFGRYHLSFLDKDKVHPIDVLSGAFMLIRKKTLEKTGLLDESFFMYGEDIDLSYRITKAGYKNYYFPKTKIIHYKGESTKKGSINYVFIFYNAMIIFAQKHLKGKNASLFIFLIRIAIYFRALLAIVNRFVHRAFFPVSDFALITTGLFLLKNYYQNYTGILYSDTLVNIAFPLYSLIWVFSILINGGYTKPVSLNKTLRGIVTGTAIILIIYALLSEEYRFSRALILLGTLWATITLLGCRWILSYLPFNLFRLEKSLKKRFAIIGEDREVSRVRSLLKKSNISSETVIQISPEATANTSSERFIPSLHQLKEVVQVFNINEIVFCSGNVPSNEIIRQMSVLKNLHVNYKIAPPESQYIIGSNSIDTGGDLYHIININSINADNNQRKKRILDLGMALLFLVLYPFTIFTLHQPISFFSNIFKVISGKRSWVGFTSSLRHQELPKIKKGILTPLDKLSSGKYTKKEVEQANFYYAQNYSLKEDLKIIWKGFKHLGRPH